MEDRIHSAKPHCCIGCLGSGAEASGLKDLIGYRPAPLTSHDTLFTFEFPQVIVFSLNSFCAREFTVSKEAHSLCGRVNQFFSSVV